MTRCAARWISTGLACGVLLLAGCGGLSQTAPASATPTATTAVTPSRAATATESTPSATAFQLLAGAQVSTDRWQVGFLSDQSSRALVVRRSQNGGETWSTSDIPASDKVGDAVRADLYFLNAHRGWLLLGGVPATVQETWTLLETSDGGRTWTIDHGSEPKSFLGLDYDAVAMTFRSPSRGVIAAAVPSNPPISLEVFTTVDGGRHWTSAHEAVPHQVGSIRAIYLALADADDEWMLLTGYPATAQEVWALLHTTDGGRNWRASAQTDFAAPTKFLASATGPSAMSFVSPALGFIVTVDSWPPGGWYVDIWRTSDGGDRWQLNRVKLPSGAANRVRSITAPAFSAMDRGSFTVQLKSGVVQFGTSDGGASWTQVR